MMAYRDIGAIFLLFLTTALYGVSSTLFNYFIYAGWLPGKVWRFLENLNVIQPTANSTLIPEYRPFLHRLP